MDTPSKIHSPYSANIRKPEHTDYPADLLKFNAWKNPVNSFDEAVSIIKSKKLVLGEPAVVPFMFHHDDDTYTIELAFGIGSTDIERPFIKCSVTNDIVNDAVIVGTDDDGNTIYSTLAELLRNFISKDEAQTIIDNAVLSSLSDETIVNAIGERVADSQVITNKMENYLKWKPISSLLNNQN